MLRESEQKILNTRIYILNPRYVLNHCKEGEAIARLSLLNGFGDNSNLLAVYYNVLSMLSGSVRGVLLNESVEGVKGVRKL